MKSFFALAIIALFTSGCLYTKDTSVLMVHTKTGDVQTCRGSFQMAMYVPISNSPDNCVKQYKSLGYKKAEELTPAEREALRPELRKFQFKGEIKQN